MSIVQVLPEQVWQVDCAFTSAHDATKEVVDLLLQDGLKPNSQSCIVLFEERFNLKTREFLKHARIVFAGPAAEHWAHRLAERKPAAARSPYLAGLDVERATRLKALLFVEGMHIIGLNWYLSQNDKTLLSRTGVLVEEEPAVAATTKLPGRRRSFRLSYDFGYIDVLAANKDEARVLVRLNSANLPKGAGEEARGVRGSRNHQSSIAAEILEVVENPKAGRAEQQIAYSRRWRGAARKAAQSLDRPRRAVTKRTPHVPRKPGPFGQQRTKKN